MTWHRFLVFLALGVLVVGCKKNSITSNNSSTNVIGSSGGSAAGPGGVELLVPGGALQQDTTFKLSIVQPDEYPDPGAYAFSGNVFAIEPHGQQFLTPATVVIPYIATPTEPVLLRAEPGDTAWTELPIIGTKGNAFEAAVSALSYFVVADKAGAGPDAGTPSCSGRGPSNSASEGTVTNATGVIPGAFFSFGHNDVDSATLQSGTAYVNDFPTNTFAINLADYAQACGYAKNNDSKIGGSQLTIVLPTATPAVQNYAPDSLDVHGTQLPDTTTPGMCGGTGAGPAGSPTSSNGSGVDITAVDANHIAGSYDVFVNGTVELQGTFDLPICPVGTSITPSCCLK